MKIYCRGRQQVPEVNLKTEVRIYQLFLEVKKVTGLEEKLLILSATIILVAPSFDMSLLSTNFFKRDWSRFSPVAQILQIQPVVTALGRSEGVNEG